MNSRLEGVRQISL